MNTVYQFEDGKLIFVYSKDGWLKSVNVVHDDENVADRVISYLKALLRDRNVGDTGQ